MNTVREMNVRSKLVLLRSEFNVVLAGDVTNDPRLRSSLPTVNMLSDSGARVVICSHLGRPWGKRDPAFSLRQLVGPLTSLLGRPISFAEDCIGPARVSGQSSLAPGEILLLENVRFYPEENMNDLPFSRKLAEGIDVYVNDAFGNCHRAHASMVGVTHFINKKAAGLLLEQELRVISSFLEQTEHPAVGIIGGAKVAGKDGKIHVIRNLLRRMDVLCLVGKIAYYFLQAMGIPVGRTLTADVRQIDAPDADFDQSLADCRAVLAEAEEVGTRIVLPVDCKTDSGGGEPGVVDLEAGQLTDDGVALDLGPRSVARISEFVRDAKSVVWNGPAGFVERERYRLGTIAIARAVSESGARALVGGGDTVAALADLEVSSQHIHVCTGGGAMLALLMGRELPAVRALAE